MTNPNVTTAIILDTRSPKKDGSFPIKLRVTYLRKQKYYGVNHSLTKDEYDKVTGPRPRSEFKELALAFAAIEERAIKAIDQIAEFTFEEFERRFVQNRYRSNDLLNYLDSRAAELIDEDRIRTAEPFTLARKSLVRFTGKEKLPFMQVTPAFLQGYENWMLQSGASPTTVGIYLRSVRAVFNIAIDSGQIDQGLYPFGKRKYVIPHARNIKKALSKADIDLIAAYQPEEGSAEEMYRDLWMFLYLANGMNVKDMLLLQGRNLDGNKLTFVRSKTQRSTKKAIKSVQVHLLPETLAILEKWGNPKARNDEFLFPNLTGIQDEAQRLAIVKQETKQINKYMRRIGKKLEIARDITTYTARHTFSTILSHAGAPIEYVSEALATIKSLPQSNTWIALRTR